MEEIIINEKTTRETDTLDTFVCSSWYYLRFVLLKKRIMVLKEKILITDACDQYIGGVEHNTPSVFTFFYESD